MTFLEVKAPRFDEEPKTWEVGVSCHTSRMFSLKETSNFVKDARQAWRSTMRGLLRRHNNYHLGCLEVRSKGVVDLGEYLEPILCPKTRYWR